MIDPKELVKMLQNNEQEIKEHFLEEVKKTISSKVEWELGREIEQMVQKFMTEEVAPEISSILLEAKPAVMKAIVKMSETMSGELAKSLMASMQENLKDSWNRKKIYDALFD